MSGWSNDMIRVRFKANEEDPRPINWPIKHPYWITGYGHDHSVIVAYADNEEYVMENWPEAEDLDVEEVGEYKFTSRFPKPEWLEKGEMMDQENVQEYAGEEDEVDRVSAAHDLVEYAWGIIANAGGGNWTLETEDWQGAAAKWRDQYHDYLRMFTRRSEEVEESLETIVKEEVGDISEVLSADFLNE